MAREAGMNLRDRDSHSAVQLGDPLEMLLEVVLLEVLLEGQEVLYTEKTHKCILPDIENIQMEDPNRTTRGALPDHGIASSSVKITLFPPKGRLWR
jgi:hypothetical protein